MKPEYWLYLLAFASLGAALVGLFWLYENALLTKLRARLRVATTFEEYRGILEEIEASQMPETKKTVAFAIEVLEKMHESASSYQEAVDSYASLPRTGHKDHDAERNLRFALKALGFAKNHSEAQAVFDIASKSSPEAREAVERMVDLHESTFPIYQ